jgi:glycosyltransferase involved in cell wall biosynthesis
MTMRPRLKIAVFHLGFFYSGGGEKLVLEEIRGLRALGHQVTCFAPYVDRNGCYPEIPEMAEIRRLLPGPPRWLPMRDPLWIILSCLLIPLKAPSFRGFDILMGANQPGPWLAFVLSKILRKPYVIYLAQPLRILHPRTVDLENGLRIREGDARFLSVVTRVAGRLIDLLDRLSVRSASMVFCNGTHVSRWISSVYGVTTVDCPGGCHPIPEPELVDLDRLSGAIQINEATINKPYMLISNRHSPMKRFEYGLWALKRVQKRLPGLSLVVTGQETTYTSQLRYLAESLGLTDRVHFVGLVSEPELLNLYKNAAVYLYPSPEEDFGMGIVEAMAAGAPVVAWRNGGPTVTVRDGETGFLIKPYDTEEFANRIVELVTNPSLAAMLGRSAAQRARALFSYDRHIRLLERGMVRVLAAGSQADRAEALLPKGPRGTGVEAAAGGRIMPGREGAGDQHSPMTRLVAEAVQSTGAMAKVSRIPDESSLEDDADARLWE